jgi:tetratricopeptide (TPR) repeat protein
MYRLIVVAIDAQGQDREQYRLNRIYPLPPALVQRWQIDNQDLQQYPLTPADHRWLRADVASAIATDRNRLPPELWWEVLAQLEPEAHHNQNPALHLRLATAYLHLGRWQEARSAAERAIAIAGNRDSFDRAEALVMRAQVTRMLQRCPEAIADLQAAQMIYRAIGLPAEAESIDLALDNVILRPCTPFTP